MKKILGYLSTRHALLGAIASLMLLISISANATLVIEIDDHSIGGIGNVDFSISDGDGDGLLGAIGSVGNLNFIIGAQSEAPVGQLNDTNIDVTAGIGTWDISIRDTMYVGPFSANARSVVTPTAIGVGHTVTLETLVDGTTILGPIVLAALSNQSAVAPVVVGNPYTIEHKIRLVSTNAGTGGTGRTSTFDTETKILPEPGVIGLMGLGFAGMVLVRRRRNRS